MTFAIQREYIGGMEKDGLGANRVRGTSQERLL